MRCPRCKFENIPGQGRCFKCGSVLGGQAAAVDVHPPRMARWKRPFRWLGRRFRRWRIVPRENTRFRVPDWLRVVSADALITVFLSVVPGLGHLIQKRFREVWWLCLAWLILILAGVFLYGGGLGYTLIGIGIGLHVWIAARTLVEEFDVMGWKIVAAAAVLVGLLLVYRLVPRLVTSDLVLGRTTLTIPYHKVQAGDYLLARRSQAGVASVILMPLS